MIPLSFGVIVIPSFSLIGLLLLLFLAKKNDLQEGLNLQTGYEEYSLKELLDSFNTQQELIDVNGNVLFKLIETGSKMEDNQVKIIGELIKGDRQEQMKIGYEFIRRFL